MGNENAATTGHDLNDTLLSMKQLAAKMGRSYNYVRAMKQRGFKLPGGRSTLANALRWLEGNPMPTAGRWWRKQ